MIDPNREYETEPDVELMAYVELLWRKRRLILAAMAAAALLAGAVGWILPKKWEVSSLLQPGKFAIQTQSGQLEEVVVVDSRQLLGQINQQAYDHMLASELNIPRRKFPKILAEAVRDTQLIRISIRDRSIEQSRNILNLLFLYIKRDLDKKVEIETKAVEALIQDAETEIKGKALDIQSSQIEKGDLTKDILSQRKKLLISETRAAGMFEELAGVRKRIEGIEEQQKKALAEQKQGADAIGLLLYSNEIQQNLRYYNTLEEGLSEEKVKQETIKYQIESRSNGLLQIDTRIEKTKNDIAGIKNQISLLVQKKGRIDYTRLAKEPTSALDPVRPSPPKLALFAGLAAFLVMILAVLFGESWKRYVRRTTT